MNMDLQLKKNERDEAFWAFFANPTYRMREKDAARKCQHSDEHKKMLFEKIDLLIDQLRSDRELLRKKQAKKPITK